MSVIALLTDFGLRDSYVGQMKLVIAGIAPGVPIVDLCHDVEPQNVVQGAWLLETSLPYLPEGAVVVAVVDPGVGTDRRALALRVAGKTALAPDNGLLSGFLAHSLRRSAIPGGSRVSLPKDVVARAISNPAVVLPQVSATFHGRDVFAPAAAWLARGSDISRLGPPVDDIVALPPFEAERLPDGSLRGQVVHVDRFGNLITTIRADQLPAHFTVRVGASEPVPFVRTFADVEGNAPLCHIDSSGFLAVAVREGSAARAFAAGFGTIVEVHVE